MCIAFVSWQNHAGFPLIVASNRDEFYNRPSDELKKWPDLNVYAGRDLKEGGTWFGVTGTGRIALITNYRDPAEFSRKALSRGQLVLDYLKSEKTPFEFLKEVQKSGSRYNGFNLIAGSFEELYYFSNKKDGIQKLQPGFYGLSNAFLDSDWPKINYGKANFQMQVNRDPEDLQGYYNLLTDQNQFPNDSLPDTGIGMEREKMLSSVFISTPEYGTKSSNLLFFTKNNQIRMHERIWQPGKPGYQDHSIEFRINKSK